MRVILSACLMFLLPVTHGAVYKWVDADGGVHFSDQPVPGAEQIKLEPVQTSVAPPSPPPPPVTITAPESRTQVPSGQAEVSYIRLDIVTPQPGETILDNQGIVGVTFNVKPELNADEGHKIQILLDGKVGGAPSPSLDQSLKGVSRGAHTISAQLVDEQGRVLIRSKPVAFEMKISSPLFHPPRPDTPPIGVQQAPRAPMAPRAPRAPHAPFRPPPPSPSPGGDSGP